MITKKKKREELQYLRDEALQSYLNRPDFQYDANGDALYRHYKDQYTQLGKTAMQDTMGQAAALTGGYGSSYAQNVGQQAYQSYLSKADDVIPELYQLAYDRYRDKGDRLYKAYQSWSQLEQQAAQQEQWEREYELEERKRQDANRRFELEQENSQIQTGTYQPDHWAMIAHYKKLGQNNQSKETAEGPEYDNGNVSEGDIKTMQRVLGLEETGKWTDEDRAGAGGLTADKAWEYYQKGQLQNYKSVGLSLPIGNIKTIERVLGLEEDGYWSKEDQKAAGGLTAHAAWKDYQKGKLQSRSRSGMSVDEWTDLKKKQSKSSGFNMKETTRAVREFIGQMMTKEQASKRGITSKEWEAMVVNRLNHVKLSAAEFHQLEMYYGLHVTGGGSDTDGKNNRQKMSYSEYRKNTAAQKVDDLQSEIQQYFRDYQLFVNAAVSSSENVGYQNATSMLESRIQTATDLQKKAEALLTSLETSGDILTGDYRELLEQISSTRKGIDSIMDFFGGQAKYYSKWATEEEYHAFAKYQTMSPDEIAAEQKARATAKEDFGIVFELSRTNMPYDWSDASYWGYTKEEFDEVEHKRKYIEEKYDVDLYADIYENAHIYNDLLDKLASLDTDIAYTTADGRNVTLQMLYDWKLAEEDLANRLATYSQNADWDALSKGMDVSSDPDRQSDYSIVFELSRTNVAYDKETALANGTSEAEWNDIEQKRQYIGRKYGVDLYADIYDNVYIFNEILGLLDGKSWESGELSTQLTEDANGDRTFKNMRHLTKDEKAVLNYIFYTQGRDAALQWHNSRMSIYQDRANGVLTKEMYDWGTDSWRGPWGLGAIISPQSLASVALRVGSGIEQIDDWITGDYNNTLARASSAIRSGVSDTTEWMIGNWDAFDFVYNTAMSGVDSKVASVLPGGTGGILLGLSAAAQATNDALERGLSQKQVFWNGMMAGVFEGIFEIWSIGDFRALKKVASTHVKDIAWNTARSMLVNASDATLKEVANIAYDTIINGDFSQYETKVRQYVINGMEESEAKKEAAQELGSQVVEAAASGVFELDSTLSLKDLFRRH